jgi:glycosyltransferase involved in cell wall biosynthesis
MSPRVAQVMAGAEVGGAETFYVTLNLALKRAGFDQKLIIRHNPRRLALLREGGCEATELTFGNWLDLTTPWRLRALFKEYRPDIVVTWLNRAAAVCPKGPYLRVARLGGYYKMKHYRGFDHVIGIVPGIVKYLLDAGWPADRVHYLPNFCRVDQVPPVDRGLHDTPAEAPLLLALARLHDDKGLDVLLDSLAELPGVYLWIAGEGPLLGDLEGRAARLGIAERVRFLGWRNDRSALFGAADICVFPSRVEPHGTVTMEAWAHGVPLVAADSSGPKEMIRPDVDGVLVPMNDADALATGIKRVMGAPDFAAKLVAEGGARAEREFSEAAVVARYLEFFDDVNRRR